MAFEKITDTSLTNKGVTGLPDVPGLTTAEMQAKFDELSRDVIIPKLNEIVDGLNGDEVGLSSKIENPETKEKDVIQNVVNAIYHIVKENSDKRHGHENKETLDKVTAELYDSINALVSMFNGISAVDKNVTADDTKIPTSGAIVNYVTELGAGDMQKAIYDKNNTGIVDDAEKLGGVAPEEYLQKASLPDATVAFEVAETRSNISTGEKVSTVFGKIKKFFADLTAPAFAQMITSSEDLLATKVTGYVPDAKAVADTYTELNGNLSVRYNTDTDTVQILYNGTWVDWKSGEQTDIPLFISGQGSVNTDISGGFTKTSGNYTGNVNLNAIVMSTTNATNTSGSYSVVIGSGKLIDRTVYKKVKFHATVSGSGSNNAYANLNTAKTNYGDRLAPKDGYQRIVTGDNVLDICDAASNGYLCFFLGVNSGTVSVTIDSIVLCK